MHSIVLRTVVQIVLVAIGVHNIDFNWWKETMVFTGFFHVSHQSDPLSGNFLRIHFVSSCDCLMPRREPWSQIT
jgi:hypothetical protein